MKLLDIRLIHYLYITAIVISFFINIHSAFSIDSEIPTGFIDRDSSVKELRKIIDNAYPSIVMIIVYDITGEETTRGCGFFFDTEGRIITNAGILKNAYSAKVISQTKSYANVSILSYDETIDTAMIKVDASDVIPLDIDFEGDIRIDDKVIALGMTETYNKSLSEGIVTSVTSIDESRVLIHGKTVAPLFSYPPSNSGPLLNSEGKVIGLTTFEISDNAAFNNKNMLFDGQTINALSARSLKSLIEKSDSITPLHPAGSKVWWQWFKHRIKAIALSAFITLYTLGFSKMLTYIVLLMIFIYILQRIYNFLKKKFKNR